jgi:hypothetical protein
MAVTPRVRSVAPGVLASPTTFYPPRRTVARTVAAVAVGPDERGRQRDRRNGIMSAPIHPAATRPRSHSHQRSQHQRN